MTPERASLAAAYVNASRECSAAADRVETRRRLVQRGALAVESATQEDLGELATALRLWSGLLAMEVVRLDREPEREPAGLWGRLRWLLTGR